MTIVNGGLRVMMSMVAMVRVMVGLMINQSVIGKASKKNRFFLGKSPKLWVGGGQES